MQDRKYQTDCQSAIDSAYDKGIRQMLAAMATGTGKTVVFSQLPDKMKAKLPGQALVLAHRDELIDQAIDKMRIINPHLKIDKDKAEDKADTVNSDVIVASVATIGRGGSKRIERYNWDAVDKIITDEAHHSTADSYKRVYEASGVLHPDTHKLLLGVTATPNRGDGKALAEIYKKIVYVYSIRQAIEDGWLVDVRGIRVNTKVSLDAVKTKGGDFVQDMLADAVNNPQRNQLIVKAWLENAQNRPTVCFTVDIQHAQDLAAMFRQHGVACEAIWGDDPERKEKLAAHRAGEITVLTNCGVLTEGYDDWRISCIVLARPTKSAILFTQMVGRGTRLQADYPGGEEFGYNLKVALDPSYNYGHFDYIKKDCLVIDVVDASQKHTLVTLPSLVGMSNALDLRGQSMIGAIKAIEQAQKEHPNLNLSQLTDITKLKAFVEDINLFDVKFPPEIENNSKLSWHPSVDGGYILMLPKHRDENDKPIPGTGGEVRIYQNMLDKFEIYASIEGKKFKGERASIEEALQAADSLIYKEAGDAVKILKREETWHGLPPTKAQLDMLQRVYKWKPLPNNLTRGQASKLIGSYLAGKAR